MYYESLVTDVAEGNLRVAKQSSHATLDDAQADSEATVDGRPELRAVVFSIADGKRLEVWALDYQSGEWRDPEPA